MSRHALFTCLLLIACDGPGVDDGGTPDGGMIDSAGPPCARDSDCGDESLFCARWRCRPGDPDTDARGCVDLGPPCVTGQVCDEALNSCGTLPWCADGREGCADPGDCDGDGHTHQVECGGDDCDDDDPTNYPTNNETCDAIHDEDCDPSSVAGESDGDLDGDGSISAACCNGDNCGPDCDDSDVNVNPGAREVCNGRDDDCNGVVDDPDGSAALCPGGTCTGGAWTGGCSRSVDRHTTD